MELDLQVLVVVLAEQLEEPQDGLHDGHSWAHLGLHLLLLCSWLNGQHSWDGGDRLALDQQGMTCIRKDCSKREGGSGGGHSNGKNGY